jgi:DNA-binding transcriptional LysR family regulator
MKKRMPSLYSLQVFDAVARRLSFTRAADDLNITQGAVSFQIKQLEANIGQPLFERGSRGITMTSAGESLATNLRITLENIYSMIEKVSRHPTSQLTISVTTYFAARWLLPRLSGFMRSRPNTEVRLAHAAGGNPRNIGDADVAIRWGRLGVMGVDADLIFECGLTPVCSPALLARDVGASGPSTLGHDQILHDDDMRGVWEEWLTLAHFSDRETIAGPVILDPNVRMEAAIDGQGFALADALVINDIESGKLAAPFDIFLEGYGYHLLKTKSPSKLVTEFSEWIMQEATNSRHQRRWSADRQKLR